MIRVLDEVSNDIQLSSMAVNGVCDLVHRSQRVINHVAWYQCWEATFDQTWEYERERAAA